MLLSIILSMQLFACHGGDGKLKKISIEQAPVISSYVGQDIVFSSMGKIKLHYKKKTEIKDITKDMLSPIDKDSKLKQLITVSYKGFTDTFELTLKENTIGGEIKSIEITEEPTVSSFVRQDLVFAKMGKIKLNYVSGFGFKDIATDMLSKIDIYSNEAQEITVNYLQHSDTFSLLLLEDIASGKASALAVVEKAYNAYKAQDYTNLAWGELTAAYEKGKVDIAAANNASDITAAKNISLTAMTLVRRKDEGGSTVVKYFGLDWSGGQNMTQDEDGTITVSYNGISQAWAPFSTAQGFELNHNYPTQNAYKMTVKNEGENEISFVLSLKTNTDPTNESSGVEVGRFDGNIGAGATKEILVSVSAQVKQVLIFVDNKTVHSNSGRVVISNYDFTYAKVPTAQNFKPSNSDFTIVDKDGTLANITYNNIAVDSWGLITHAVMGYSKENNMIAIKVKNNGIAPVRYMFNAGTFVAGALQSCINVNANYNGIGGYLAAGAVETIYLIVDYAGTAYPGATPPAQDVVPTDLTFFIDNCYYEQEFEGQLRSGNLDIISIEMSNAYTR